MALGRGARFAAAVLALALLASCGGDDATRSPAPPSLEERLQSLLDDAVQPDSIPGALFAVDLPGTVHWEGAAGLARTASDDSLVARSYFRAGSVTKMFTAVLALQEVEAGRLELDGGIADWLPPPLADTLPGADAITLRMLLNHTTGLADYADNPRLREALLADPAHVWTLAELLALALELEQPGSPGGAWHYANTNYALLQEVLERETGVAWARLVEERIAGPFVLDDTFVPPGPLLPSPAMRGYEDLDGDGELDDVTNLDPSYLRAAASIVSTTHDLAIFTRALFRGELLGAPMLHEMQTTIPTDLFTVRYGLGLVQFSNGLRGHPGLAPGYAAGAFYLPARDLVLVVALNNGAATQPGLNLLARVMALFTGSSNPARSAALPGETVQAAPVLAADPTAAGSNLGPGRSFRGFRTR